MKLLLIDDQINVISSIKEAIEPAGHDCVMCEKPEQAIRLFKENPFDVVITDYRMPNMNGIEVLKKVQTIRPETPVILLTGYADVNNAIDAVNHGAYAFFQKPIQLKRLLAAIHEIGKKLHNRKEEENLLSHLVHEREILLREVHHRVRNNLQIIRSLLKLHSRVIQHPEALDAVTDIYNRIFSMSLIHERVFQYDDFEKVDFAIFSRELASMLSTTYGFDVSRISIDTRMDSLFVNIETAVPAGLIVNELVTNAIKHAFRDGKHGTIRVALKTTGEGQLELTVADNGVGLPDTFDFQTVQSMGLYLVRLLAEYQLDGTVHVRRKPGTEFKIFFKEKLYSSRIPKPSYPHPYDSESNTGYPFIR